jgi:hypothetical protein
MRKTCLQSHAASVVGRAKRAATASDLARDVKTLASALRAALARMKGTGARVGMDVIWA